MQMRALGRSGVEVSAVAFGAWAIGGWQWGGSDDAAARAALLAGLDAGLTSIDTAPVYGFGHSEQVIGRALAGRRAQAQILTKVGLVWEEERGEFFFEGSDQNGVTRRVYKNSRPDSIRREVEASLRRLAVEQLDLVQIHWPDPTTPLADSLGALSELRTAGKLRAIGVSNFKPAQLEEAQRVLGDVPLASTQERYSLVARGIEAEVLPKARAQGIAVLAYSPIEQGLLSGRVSSARTFPPGDNRTKRGTFSAENRTLVNALLERVARPAAVRLDASLAQVVIAWTLAQPGITSALVGARTPEQARENARAGELELTTAEIAAIDRGFAELELQPPGGGALRRLIGRLRDR
jgi:methylglyoxal reductase